MDTNKNGDGDIMAKKRKRPIALGLVLLLLLIAAGLIFGYFWFTDTLTYASTDNAAINGEQMNITSRMPGRIKSINVEEGDTVKAGQVIVLLEDTDLRAQEKQAAAALNSARKNLALAKVNINRSESDFNRVKTLFETGAATKEQYDHAHTALETANARYAIAQSQVDAAIAQLGVIKTQLLHTKITSPIPGVVARQSFHPGDFVQPGQTIFIINNLDSIWVMANFEETKIRNIRIDAKVQITVDAYPGFKLDGRVVMVSAAIVPPPFSIGEFTKTTQHIPVKIEFTKKYDSLRLLPGMSVEVKVRIK